MTSTPTSYVQTWTRQGAERTVTPPVPEAVSPSSYALVFDPREDAIVYVRVTGYHQIGEAWRYRAGAWEGPLGQPIQASTEGLWQGHYDTARGAVVLWTIADGAPLGVTVSTEADGDSSNDTAADAVDVSGGSAGALQLKKAKIKVPKSGAVAVPVSCPGGGGPCSGTLTLSTKKGTAGTGNYQVGAGQSTTVTVKLTKKAKKTLAKKGKLKVVATAGNSTAKLTLKYSKKKG